MQGVWLSAVFTFFLTLCGTVLPIIFEEEASGLAEKSNLLPLILRFEQFGWSGEEKKCWHLKNMDFFQDKSWKEAAK